MAAEYVLSEGNYNVVLCERGIRTFETATRFTLDLNAVPVLKKLTHLPVIVDPSHGTATGTTWRPWRKPASPAGRRSDDRGAHAPEIAFSDGIQS